MDSTSAARAEERPLSQAEFRAVLQALVADEDDEDRPPPPPRLLPRRPLTASEWAEAVALVQCRAAFAEPDEAPRACDHEPGSEGKLRELRRRQRAGVALWNRRDRQLPASERTVAGSCRFLSRLADAAREASRRQNSARASACARKNGVAE
jgi:hypothetical protein